MAQRIALFGLFGGPNIGNNATLEAMLQAIRRVADAEVVAIAPRGSQVERYGVDLIEIDPLPIARYLWRIKNERLAAFVWNILQTIVEPLRIARARRALAGTDKLIVAGTGVIDEFGQTSLNLPLDVFRWTLAARRVGATVHFVSVGAEPLRSPLAKWLFRRALRRATSISLRDEFSLSQVRALGFALSKNAVYPDLAFSLPARTTTRERAHPPFNVIVGVMGYMGWNQPRDVGERIYARYVEKTAHVVGALLNAGHRVTLMLGDTRADARALADVRKALAMHERAAQLYSDDDGGVANMLARFQAADAVIAARFHNVLLGLLAGCAVVSISYSRKNDALMAAMGAGGCCHPIEEFEPQDVLASLAATMTHAPDDRGSIIQAWRARLDEQYQQILRD